MANGLLGEKRGVLRPPGRAFLVAFGLTVASFIFGTVVVERFHAGIRSAAQAIARNSTPSVSRLTAMRTAVRHLEVLTDDLVDRVFAGGSPEGFDAIMRELDELDAQHRAYRDLPVFPGETEMWPKLDVDTATLRRTLVLIQERTAKRQGNGAEKLLGDELKPLIDRLDDTLKELIDLNATWAADQAAVIDRIQATSQRWAIALDVASAFFAAAAAFAAVRVSRSYAWLMERRIEELNQFAARVSHDIRGPLSAMTLALELAKRSEPGSPELEAALLRGSRTLVRAKEVVDGLLAFSRAAATSGEEARASLRQAIDGVLEETRPVAAEKAIELRAGVFADCFVQCSPGVLTSLLSNLVGNAIKYMGEAAERHIEIAVTSRWRMVRVEVMDTGAGVPADLQDVIFEPFTRGRTTGVPGLGLGLATVRRLAEGHGGSVGLESTEGRGSIFWFELPLAPEHAPVRHSAGKRE